MSQLKREMLQPIPDPVIVDGPGSQARRLRGAVVGLGHQGTKDHLPGMIRSPAVELVALCDIDRDKLDRISSAYGIQAFDNCSELFREVPLDFIIASTPHDKYLAIVAEAARYGIHILKEKPFARNLAEARHLAAIAEANKIIISTGLQRRHSPLHRYFFEMLPLIGEPFFIDIKYTIFVDAPHVGWRGNRDQAGGGCIIDMGYHMVDLLIWYFGLPSQVLAGVSSRAVVEVPYDAEDTASIVFQYDNNLHGICILSRFYSPKSEHFKVIGSNGTIEVGSSEIRLLHKNGELIEQVSALRPSQLNSVRQISQFCEIIRGKAENRFGPRLHLAHAAFVDACYESVRIGAFVNPRHLLELSDA